MHLLEKIHLLGVFYQTECLLAFIGHLQACIIGSITTATETTLVDQSLPVYKNLDLQCTLLHTCNLSDFIIAQDQTSSEALV